MALEGWRDMGTPCNLRSARNQGKAFGGHKDEKVESRWQCGGDLGEALPAEGTAYAHGLRLKQLRSLENHEVLLGPDDRAV